jgi:hypothetical protein
MVTRIWHGATAASRSDEYLNLMRNRRHTRLPLYPRQQGSLRAASYGGRVNAIMIFASHRLRNCNIRTPETAMATTKMTQTLTISRLIWLAPCLPSTAACLTVHRLPEATQ